MKMEQFTFSASDGAKLAAYLWLPDDQVNCVLQVTHGMTEHMGRYEDFAADLCRQGVAVAGFDLRGHGANPGNGEVASFGDDGWTASIEDMRLFWQLLEDRFPGKPHFLLGFSLGSFLLREYLQRYSQGVAGAIIAGTGHQPGAVLSMIMAIVKGQIKKAGFDGTTDLVRNLSFGTYNQKFKPNRTTADWLCGDHAQLDVYLADPLVRKDISAGLFWQLLASMKRTGKCGAYAGWDPKLPVLLLYGENDPVGDFGKGAERVYKQMKQAGMQDVEFCGIRDARHDIFHENACGATEMVRHDISDWLNGVIL